MPIEKSAFLAAMSHAAAGVNAITTAGPAGRAGKTVSSMCSLCAEPPSLLACVFGGSRAAGIITENGCFCLNLLNEGQREISDTLAGIKKIPGDPFDSGDWTHLKTGAPVLKSALCSFDCELAAHHDFGTHRIFIGTVVGVIIGEGKPLVYSQRQYRRIIEH